MGQALAGLPEFSGRPVRIRFQPRLTAHRGRLLSGQGRGSPVHAGTFPRRRLMILETELLADRAELRRVLAHEIFHFVWLRLGNARRRSFEDLIAAERGAREAGWSAAVRKGRLTAADRGGRSRAWREYACESFCDTAAWLFAGEHGECDLRERARARRQRWFAENLATRALPV